jgi:hypothetical protein
MYIHYDGDFCPNITILDDESVTMWFGYCTDALDLTACVWMVPGTVDPRD